MLQAILFDLDDTLMSLAGCEAQALRRTVRAAGLASALPAGYVAVYARISSAQWAASSGGGFTLRGREQAVEGSWRDFLAHYGLDAASTPDLAERFWDEFCRSSALNPGAEMVVARLAEAYRLGMITNGYSDSQRGRLAAAGWHGVFSPLLISEEVGLQKPDARIFEMALKELDLPASAALFVGDSLSHDREGCLRAGIDFCHYCPGPANQTQLPAVTGRISDLRELLPLLLPYARR